MLDAFIFSSIKGFSQFYNWFLFEINRCIEHYVVLQLQVIRGLLVVNGYLEEATFEA